MVIARDTLTKHLQAIAFRVSPGATLSTWYLAEGSTAWGFSDYVTIENPNPVALTANITYMPTAGSNVTQQVALPASSHSRKTIRVNDVADVSNSDLSVKVHADRPIIAERAMYWGAGGALGEACHDSIGMNSAHTIFYLPDGQSDTRTDTWTLVINPNNADVRIQVAYLKPAGTGNVTFTDTVPVNSRKTYNMADKLTGRASVMVSSRTTGKKTMVERAT